MTRMEKLTSDVQEPSTSRYNEGYIKSFPQTPQYDSAVMVRKVSRWPSTHNAKRLVYFQHTRYKLFSVLYEQFEEDLRIFS